MREPLYLQTCFAMTPPQCLIHSKICQEALVWVCFTKRHRPVYFMHVWFQFTRIIECKGMGIRQRTEQKIVSVTFCRFRLLCTTVTFCITVLAIISALYALDHRARSAGFSWNYRVPVLNLWSVWPDPTELPMPGTVVCVVWLLQSGWSWRMVQELWICSWSWVHEIIHFLSHLLTINLSFEKIIFYILFCVYYVPMCALNS